MALEITELFLRKLNLLCGEETKVDQRIEQLKELLENLRGAEDHTIEKWDILLRDVYSLEDIVDSLIYGKSLKSRAIFFRRRFCNKLGQLISNFKKSLPSPENDAQVQPGASSSNSKDVQQAPTSSDLGTGNEPISENKAPAALIPPEGSQNSPRFRRTGSVGAQLPSDSPDIVMDTEGLQNLPKFRRSDTLGAGPPPMKLLSKSWSDAHLFAEYGDEEATILNPSYKTLEEAGDYSEEKSVPIVMEDLLNNFAQPVLSLSKLQSHVLEADVSSSGKAILLWTVYNAETVKQHFNFRAWVNVSEMSEELQIVNAILEHCNDVRGVNRESLPQWQILHDFLVWKRFLIVLYGVQEGFPWDSLEPIFPFSLNGSRVILAIPHSDGSKSIGKAPDESPQRHLVKPSVYLEDPSITSAMAAMDELTKAILSPRKLSFLISIVGVVGSGKTTLLWQMYNAEDVHSHFQCCAWVHVPEVFNERGLLTDIWEQVTGLKTEILLPLKSLRQRLRSFLAHKRYLVVLYDVWTAEIWEYIKSSLPNSLNGSRVVLAVQEVDVAQRTNSWVFKITSRTELLHNLKDMQENASEQKLAKRWEKLADIMDEASAIVGLEDKQRELAELVLNSHNLHFLVSVLGLAGSGKTTLVRTFYNSVASKQHFECRAWISVPQDYEERDILLDLFRQLRKEKDNRSLSVEQLRKGLSLFLTRKRYLIVLDDVRTLDIWGRLNHVIPNSANGSRVILTIRKSYLAYHMNPRAAVLSLRPLDNEESWKLFTEKVQTDIDDIPPQLKDSILQRCRGIPLTIVLLGGLLSSKNKGQDYTEWFNVIDQTNKRREKKKGVSGKDQLASSAGKENSTKDQSSSLAQQVPSDDKKKLTEHATPGENQLALFATEQKDQSQVVTDDATFVEDQSTSSGDLTSPDEISLSNTMAVTYKHLTLSSKCCLLYLGLFPRSYEIPIRRLLQLWIAEGLVTQGPDETKPLEDLADSCFKELLKNNMIEIADVRLDGRPKTCRVTNALYDELLPNAEKVGFFHVHRSSGTSQVPQSTIRRLAEHMDMYINTNPQEICIQHLRSYISFYNRKGDEPTSGVSKLLNNIIKGGFGMLVVLDLEGVYKPVLSEMVGKLHQLKYLGLRRTLLDSVPESVGCLPRLENLDIKHTYIVTLPSTIWEARRLQHLHMSEIYFDVRKSTRGSLKNLQTLWGLIIRRKARDVDWLVSLTGLRKLKLTCHEASMEVIARWLSKLSNLQSLKLRSISDSNKPARLAINTMRNLTDLSRLYLLGELPNSFKVSDLPENLEVLTMSVSHLTEDPMEALGKLGKLKVLRLYAHSFKGQNMTCRREGFPQLQVLKLWMLQELRSWTVEDKAMPVLKEVEIRCCKKLERVDGLEKLTALKEFTLTNMEPSFIEHARAKVGGKVEIINNVWKFPPPWGNTQAEADAQAKGKTRS